DGGHGKRTVCPRGRRVRDGGVALREPARVESEHAPRPARRRPGALRGGTEAGDADPAGAGRLPAPDPGVLRPHSRMAGSRSDRGAGEEAPGVDDRADRQGVRRRFAAAGDPEHQVPRPQALRVAAVVLQGDVGRADPVRGQRADPRGQPDQAARVPERRAAGGVDGAARGPGLRVALPRREHARRVHRGLRARRRRGHAREPAQEQRGHAGRDLASEGRRTRPHRQRDRGAQAGASRPVGARAGGVTMIFTIVGARPNFMKAAPIHRAFERAGIAHGPVHTGQHYDEAMSKVFFGDLGMPRPVIDLGVGSGTHAQQTAAVMVGLEAFFTEKKPEAVLVVGDVMRTLASSLVTPKMGIFSAHVEAGLRSRDWSMPEEVNRIVTDSLADLLLTPSPDGDKNLLAEGCEPDSIVCVGNVMIDTLLEYLPRARDLRTPEKLGLTPGNYAVL